MGEINVVIDKVRSSLHSRVLGSKGKEVKVVPSQIKEGVVLGAAALMIDKEFTIYD